MDLNNNALFTRFSCPVERFLRDLEFGVINGETYFKAQISYYISDVGNVDTHRLFISNTIEGNNNNLRCWACEKLITNTTYYSCTSCTSKFHRECVETPSVFLSPNHPKHSLRLIYFPNTYHRNQCCYCGISDTPVFYCCYICNIFFHPICAKTPTPLTINHWKRHEHTLYYFQRLSHLFCNVCGLDDKNISYICLQCDFIVHKRCIYSPNIIKMSHHNHRLAFTSKLSSKEFSCGVCHGQINENYGNYSCTKGCSYFVHSRCALRSDICDGKELEEIPEETYEEIKPFEEIDDGIIRHFRHMHHHLRFDQQTKTTYNENKHCEACILPFYDGNAYNCVECDFSLHETCAYIPRVKQSMLHIHPLTLKSTNTIFTCAKCDRYSNRLAYVCDLEGCTIKVDIRCVSISQPLDHQFHQHPLFLTYEYQTQKKCSICEGLSDQPLNCIKCDFILCFRCATTPYKVRYKHDDHLLKFSYEKYGNERIYRCDKCEEMLYQRYGFYGCNKCGVILHVECLLGKDPYLKPGYMTIRMVFGHVKCEVFCNNNSLMRSICERCRKRCSSNIKIIELDSKTVYCSMECLWRMGGRLVRLKHMNIFQKLEGDI